MKIVFSVVIGLLFASSVNAAYIEGEYNVWRRTDGVLYATTQTEDNQPVLVSIVGPGTNWSSIVISYIVKKPCDVDKKSAEIYVNMGLETLDFSCQKLEKNSIVSYTVSKPTRANELYADLKSGFTVVIDKRINIWAANIREPKQFVKIVQNTIKAPPKGGFFYWSLYAGHYRWCPVFACVQFGLSDWNRNQAADYAVGDALGGEVIYPCYSLVDHADGATVERHPDNEPRSERRRAWRLAVSP